MKKKVRSDLPPLAWQTHASFYLTTVGQERTLSIFVACRGADWLVAAIETPKDATTPESVFDSHAHKIVGSYDSAGEAFQAAESFRASWWKGHKASSFREVCACDEIDSSCPHIVGAVETGDPR